MAYIYRHWRLDQTGRFQDAGRIAPRFVTSSDVHDLKVRLDPVVKGLDTVVAACPDMPDVLVKSWQAFSLSWRNFFSQEEGFWSAGAEMDQAEAYQADIQNWQAKIAAAPCQGGKPSAYMPPSPSTEGETDKSIGDIASTVKVIAVIGGLVALAYYADKAGLLRGIR